jgi:hypothetical protein
VRSQASNVFFVSHPSFTEANTSDTVYFSAPLYRT